MGGGHEGGCLSVLYHIIVSSGSAFYCVIRVKQGGLGRCVPMHRGHGAHLGGRTVLKSLLLVQDASYYMFDAVIAWALSALTQQHAV